MRGMIRHAAALSTLLAAFSLTTTAQTPDSDGAALYQQRCASCHGKTGRGDGEYAGLLNPRPRDFTSGRFKFVSIGGQGALRMFNNFAFSLCRCSSDWISRRTPASVSPGIVRRSMLMRH